MSRYQQLFSRLAAAKEGAFVPFVTIGDPNPDQSFEIIETLINAGADALELVIPFSDPLADGPTIQNATLRALHAGTTPETCFQLLARIRAKYPNIPIGLLMYANLVFHNGIDRFYARCAEVGVDSVLIADVPIELADEFAISAEKYHIAPIFICPPNADDALIAKIAEKGRGYTYFLSRAGVTGTETRAQKPATHLIKALAKHNAPPALQGFGISEPSQVKEALEAGAAGAISGSAIVKIIEQNQADQPTLLAKLGEFVRSMKAATRSDFH